MPSTATHSRASRRRNRRARWASCDGPRNASDPVGNHANRNRRVPPARHCPSEVFYSSSSQNPHSCPYVPFLRDFFPDGLMGGHVLRLASQDGRQAWLLSRFIDYAKVHYPLYRQ